MPKAAEVKALRLASLHLPFWGLSSATVRCCLSTASVLSPRDVAAVEDAAAHALRMMPHPLTYNPLSAHNCIRSVRCEPLHMLPSGGSAKLQVNVQIEALSPAAAHYASFAHEARRTVEEALRGLPAVTAAGGASALDIRVHFVSQPHSRAIMAAAGPGLAGIGSVIAVSSGKGGVGKSTVAVNLAFALAARGARVGLLDADVQGPSLPTMVTPDDLAVRKQADGTINPLRMTFAAPHAAAASTAGSASGAVAAASTAVELRRGGAVAMMSYGWVAPRNARGERTGGAMRGPMTSSVVQQLLKFTDWGQLDHLIVDLPPGTGDVHVTIGQTVPLATAVIVTTPQRLALADVAKGLDMFAALKVHSSAVVLNMAYWTPPTPPPSPAAAAAGAAAAGSSGEQVRIYPFGDARHPQRLVTERGRDGVLRVLRGPDGQPLLREWDAAAAADAATATAAGAAPALPPPPTLAQLRERYAIDALHELPIHEGLSAAGDSGVPFVLAFPDSPLAAVYSELAGHVAQVAERNVLASEAAAASAAASAASSAASSSAASAQAGSAASAADAAADAEQQTFNGSVAATAGAALGGGAADAAVSSVSLRYSPSRSAFAVRLYSASGAREVQVPTAALRLACKCAACVDEATGEIKVRADRIPADLKVTSIKAQGNYGVAIAFSDRHDTGIFTWEQIAGVARGLQKA